LRQADSKGIKTNAACSRERREGNHATQWYEENNSRNHEENYLLHVHRMCGKRCQDARETKEMEINRLAELEKIAEKLGIGRDREVECVSCKSKIQFKNAIILTKKDEVKYLCEECNKKLEQGDLQLIKQDPSISELIKKLNEGKDGSMQPTPYSPKDWQPIIPDWEPKYPEIGTGGNTWDTYTVSSMNASSSRDAILLRLEPNYANRTNSNTK